MPASDPVNFSKAQHIKYWLRCLKTHLPTQYTSNDSQRITFAFFTLSALDLLGVLHERTSASERADYTEWIYRCQHPDGGFRGFTGADLGEARLDKTPGPWDPANLAATFFALAALTVLGDTLERVKRRDCLAWLESLQLKDGSFGEALGEGGGIEGGGDIRYCYLAAAVRWVLRGDEEIARGEESIKDIDVPALVGFITSSQVSMGSRAGKIYVDREKSYEGGIAQAPFHEAHAGWTYCGIGALSLLGKLPSARGRRTVLAVKDTDIGSSFLENVVHFLVNLQTSSSQEEELIHTSSTSTSIFHVQGASVDPPQNVASSHPEKSLSTFPLPTVSLGEIKHAGFGGRCNKIADTCYSFWAGGTLAILSKVHLIDFHANRSFLEKTQHIIGGFGKYPRDPPDILHSYLGLAALAAMREPELKSIDPVLCISVSAREWLEAGHQRGHAAAAGGEFGGGND